MKPRIWSRFLLLSVAALLLAGAKDALKKPELKVDPTPVGEGRPGLVTSYADALEPVQHAVVSVYSKTIVKQQTIGRLGPFLVPGPEVEREQSGLGSGVIVSPDGYILTNNHVVEGADELEVALPDGRKFSAKTVGTDPKTDIAVIRIEAGNLPVVTLADSSLLRVGDVVFAIGNPLEVGQTVTMGIVSATGRKVGILADVFGYEDFIQTDASINMGNSGGALVDVKGRLVGINSAILSTPRGGGGNIGIGFAIPVNLASRIMHDLIETGSVSRGYLGIEFRNLTPEIAEGLGVKETKGVVVMGVEDPGPAARAGLKLEDIVVSVNDKPVTTVEDLRVTIAQMAPGTKVELKYLREGKVRTAMATLDRRPDDNLGTTDLLEGITVSGITDEHRRKYRIRPNVDGLVVTNVGEQSLYAGQFAPGMVIVQINRQPVNELAAARRLILAGRRNMLTVFFRGAFDYVFINVK
ncbi:MAG: protease Do, partial [Verrucomicrobia bacterium RIFCSPLOWO2_12_FULL_64_8]